MIEPVEVTVADCAYLAALVDTKASIFVKRRARKNGRASLELVLQLEGLSKSMFIWLESRFPGIRGALTASLRYRGTWVTQRACAVLVRVFSFLKSQPKIAQARLVFKFNEIKPSAGRKWTDTEVELRTHLAEQIRRAAKPPSKIKAIETKAPCLTVSRVTGG